MSMSQQCKNKDSLVLRQKLFLSVMLLVMLLVLGCKGGPKSTSAKPMENKIQGSSVITARDDLFGLYFSDRNTGWLVGYWGGIFYTQNAGKTFERQDSGSTEALMAVSFADDSKNGWVVGDPGTILHTSDGGKKWDFQKSGTTESLTRVQALSQSEGWVTGTVGTLLHTTDGGVTWVNQSLGKDVSLFSLYFADHNNGWIVGEFGTILHTTNGGQEWMEQKSGVQKTLFDVHFLDVNRGVVVGIDGLIFYTEDGGKQWTMRDSGCKGSLFCVHGKGEILWAGGAKGAIVKSIDGGHSWDIENNPRREYISGAFVLGSSNPFVTYFVGSRGTFFELASTPLECVKK